MTRVELLVELDQLAAETALCRANLREIAGALDGCRYRLRREGPEPREGDERRGADPVDAAASPANSDRG